MQQPQPQQQSWTSYLLPGVPGVPASTTPPNPKPWRKWYYGLAGVGLMFLAYARVTSMQRQAVEAEEAKVREATKTAERKALLPALYAGKTIIDDSMDAFEGLTPKQIQQFIDSNRSSCNPADPFEGMSPNEIDEYAQKHNL